MYAIIEPNNVENTATTVAFLFGCKSPLSWIGEVPKLIFK